MSPQWPMPVTGTAEARPRAQLASVPAGRLRRRCVLGRWPGSVRSAARTPAVHGAGEGGAIGLAEPAEVCSQVGAAALDNPVSELDVVFVVVLLGVPAFGVHQPIGRQALEKRVQILVVRADPAGPEAHAQEQAVDPVGLVVSDQGFDQRAMDSELVAA